MPKNLPEHYFGGDADGGADSDSLIQKQADQL
jgi:hypothetical protein